MKANIFKLHLLQVCTWFLLLMPVIIPFFTDLGFEMEQIMWLQAIFGLSVVVTEVPSGYFADRVGRKASLVLGFALATAGWTAFALADDFAGFVVGEILLGIGSGFQSGSGSALLFDSLLSLDRRQDYLRLEGRNGAIGNFSEAAGGLAGGFLAAWNLQAPLVGQAVLAGLGLLVATTLKEPPLSRDIQQQTTWRASLASLWQALRHHRELRGVLLFTVAISTATLTMAWFAQRFFQAVEVPLAWFGVLWTILNATVGLGAWFAYRLKSSLPLLSLCGLILLGVVAGYLGAAFSAHWLGILGIGLVYLSRGVGMPVFKEMIHELAPESVRATLQSIRSFLIRLFFSGMGPWLGYLTDHWDVYTALTLAALIYGSGALVALIFLRKLPAT